MELGCDDAGSEVEQESDRAAMLLRRSKVDGSPGAILPFRNTATRLEFRAEDKGRAAPSVEMAGVGGFFDLGKFFDRNFASLGTNRVVVSVIDRLQSERP